MEEAGIHAPLLNEERDRPPVLHGFDIRQRPYKSSAQKGTVLKHTWELAPRGAVFYFRQRSEAPHKSSLFSLRGNSSFYCRGDSNQNGDEDMLYISGVQQKALGQLRATAVAGNDITSSCLYATGIMATAGGRFAPFSSVLVCLVLYIFRGIYGEVFSAFPMNGGTYSALLNTVDKSWASVAAILSTLSYAATAVTSAASAGEYLHSQWEVLPSKWISVGIMCFFAVLTLLGIRESANAATVLFLSHVLILFALIISALVYVVKDNGMVLRASWNSPSPVANPCNGWVSNIFFGYCSALLGVTGFESSSNYIEEQKSGVFIKTLRNMWCVVMAVNPALALLTMGVIPIEQLVQNSNFSLALLAETAVGPWLRVVVVVDAALVLSGAVLTAYVGIEGLHRRLALDRVMPEFFLFVNRWRGTNHFIIIGFCLLICSLRLLVGDISTLGGVYAISFLSVMMLLCLSNFFLKFKRGKLPRDPIVHPLTVLLAFFLVGAGLVGNIVRDPSNAMYFMIYFVFFSSVVVLTRARIAFCRLMHTLIPETGSWLRDRMRALIYSMRRVPVIYFAKQPELSVLNKVIQYIIDNEETHTVKIIHLVNTGERFTASEAPHRERRFLGEDIGSEDEASDRSAGAPVLLEEEHAHLTMQEMETCCAIIDQLYPKITIELLFVLAPFTPKAVHEISLELGVPRNFMFMGCPGDRFPHLLGHFGGVRVITY